MSVDLGATYVFLHPDGTRAVMGNSAAAQADPDWCAFVDDVLGLGLPEKRGSSSPLTEGDGAIPGNYYDGEMPFSFSAWFTPNATPTVQNARADKLVHATDCKRVQGMLDWTETGRAPTRVWYSQPSRPTWSNTKKPKVLVMPLVSANSRVLTATEHSQTLAANTLNGAITAGSPATGGALTVASTTGFPTSGTVHVDSEQITYTGVSGATLTGITRGANGTTAASHSNGTAVVLGIFNAGSRETLPRFTIATPSATVNLANVTTGEVFTFTGLSGGGTVTLDFNPPYPSIMQGGVRKDGAEAFPSSIWWALQKGSNAITCTNAATILWRDAY